MKETGNAAGTESQGHGHHIRTWMGVGQARGGGKAVLWFYRLTLLKYKSYYQEVLGSASEFSVAYVNYPSFILNLEVTFSLGFSDQYSTGTGLYWWHFPSFSRLVTKPQGTWASLHLEFIILHYLAYVISCKYLSSRQLVVNYTFNFDFFLLLILTGEIRNIFTSVSVLLSGFLLQYFIQHVVYSKDGNMYHSNV